MDLTRPCMETYRCLDREFFHSGLFLMRSHCPCHLPLGQLEAVFRRRRNLSPAINRRAASPNQLFRLFAPPPTLPSLSPTLANPEYRITNIKLRILNYELHFSFFCFLFLVFPSCSLVTACPAAFFRGSLSRGALPRDRGEIS